jgi:hypothetical protein
MLPPVRHAYAALMMEQGNLEEAAKTYRADLGMDTSVIRPRRHPNKSKDGDWNVSKRQKHDDLIGTSATARASLAGCSITAKTYRADLGMDTSVIRPRRHPNNVWSLQGYHECLVSIPRSARYVFAASSKLPCSIISAAYAWRTGCIHGHGCNLFAMHMPH